VSPEPDYTVRLEQVFQGPMDLLLHLVREQEVEIHEIEIARVVDGFLAYLKQMDKLDLELAGDFVVMAATLMAIKSRSLLPADEVDLEDDLDPRDELIERLIEYRRFREASEALEGRFRRRAAMFPRGWRDEARTGADERELDLGDLDQWDLLATWSRLLRETNADRPHMVIADPHPLRFYVDHLVAEVKLRGALSLADLIESYSDVGRKEAIVGSFCALLELVRLQVVQVSQPRTGADIAIELKPEHAQDIEELVAESGLGDEQAREGWDQDARNGGNGVGNGSDPLAAAEPQ
jgi:segregation and condensation protein A